MITETGRVVALRGDRAWVQTIRTSACQSCSARTGCGQKVLAAASGGRANQILVSNSVNARVGDEVTIGIDDQALLGASFLVYAVPLLLMVAASVIGHQVSGGHDGVSMLAAIVGLGLGFVAGRHLQRAGDVDYEPRLVRINRIDSESCL
ncbi:SoxR reducing system RseC family protein [Marinobacter sp. F3R08]|uniref:SoxR reducing system RseC family protein n=1 Tax=Marinobacter sp. F3R08 TaxID=2841559 RepID=UPI001C08E6AF|nr:SoxR reducing system RseC family protein [Marinobacter sp. F3R08]MBU2954131.1 SoxR reducing system RseC family protein [Marinobacter sp. F3R08]